MRVWDAKTEMKNSLCKRLSTSINQKCIRHSKRATIKLVNILLNEQQNMQIAQKSIRSSMIEQRQLCVMNTKSFFLSIDGCHLLQLSHRSCKCSWSAIVEHSEWIIFTFTWYIFDFELLRLYIKDLWKKSHN